MCSALNAGAAREQQCVNDRASKSLHDRCGAHGAVVPTSFYLGPIHHSLPPSAQGPESFPEIHWAVLESCIAPIERHACGERSWVRKGRPRAFLTFEGSHLVMQVSPSCNARGGARCMQLCTEPCTCSASARPLGWGHACVVKPLDPHVAVSPPTTARPRPHAPAWI